MLTAAAKYYADFVKSLSENSQPKTDVRPNGSVTYTQSSPIPEPLDPTAPETLSSDPSKISSGARSDRELFREWLIRVQTMTEDNAENCSSAIIICEDLATRLRFSESHLYGVDYIKAQDIIRQLKKTSAFWKENTLQNNRYNSAIFYYLQYLWTAGQQKTASPEILAAKAEPNKSDQNTGSDAPVETTPRQDSNPYAIVLEQRFGKGFRLGSPLDMKKFKRFYEEITGSPVNEEDDAIEKKIRGCGIIYDNKVFLPKAMLSQDVKERLRAYIEDSFNSGVGSIYFDALFRNFSDDFLAHQSCIYNAVMLRSYIAFEYGDKYVIGRNRISKGTGAAADPVDEVRSCLKSYGRPMKKDDLYAALAHLPRAKVDLILSNNLEFVRNNKGVYFHADTLSLSNEELENIAELIENAIRSHKYISGSELMNDIRVKYPHMYEGYSNYSDIGWRDALKYKFGGRYSFDGNIISSIWTPLSMSDVFSRLGEEADSITMDELRNFAEDMGTVIYFDAVYRNMFRVNEDTFVSKKRAAFQVKETDKILDRYCAGNYISLADVRDFGIFPDAGFPWTVYLLESYAALYSERYSLLHSSFNRDCAVGAIVKKDAGYKSFDDLLVDVIADSGIPLNKKDALEFLVNSGYIARRAYTNIEELMIRANSQRNRKGKP